MWWWVLICNIVGAQALTSTLPDDFSDQEVGSVHVCTVQDLAFECPRPMRPASDYAQITGLAPVSTSVVACPCDLVPPSIASTRITDLPTLCSLTPPPEPPPRCLRSTIVGTLPMRLTWYMSQLPASVCPAQLSDTEGPCGDEFALQRFAPLCVLVPTNATDTQTVLDPYVPADRVWWESQHPSISNECTAEYASELVSSGAVACANRTCTFPEPIASVQSECLPHTPDSCNSMNVVSYACARSGATLSPDESGCSSAFSATLCSDVRVCEDPIPSVCTPVKACAQTDPASVPGTLPTGKSCTYACPDPPPTFRLQHTECDAPACGQTGSLGLVYEPCPDPSAIGCLAYPSPRNATVSCTSDPCSPFDGGSMGSDMVHMSSVPVLGRTGEICVSGALDMHGTCCEQTPLDACGMCVGAHYGSVGPVRVGLDLAGTCCSGQEGSRPVLTSDLVCCSDASALDVCGVCGGTGTTCWVAMGDPAPLPVDRFVHTQASNMSKALGVNVVVGTNGQIFAPPGSGAALARLVAAFLDTARSEGMQGTPVSVQGVGATGNGVCELGETPEAEPACALSYRTCPSLIPDPVSGEFVGDPGQTCGGNGVCVRAAQMCRCSYGYTGLTCGSCANGFVLARSESGSLLCAPANAQDIISALGSSGGGLAGKIAGGVVGSVLASVLAGAYAQQRRRVHAALANWVAPLLTHAR